MTFFSVIEPKQQTFHHPRPSPSSWRAKPVITLLLTLQWGTGPNTARAADQYWDTNGATPGAQATPTGSWTGANWNGSSAGTNSTGSWTAGNTAIFSAGTDAVNAFNVTVDGAQSIGGITVQRGTPSISGGSFSLTSGAVPFVIAGTANIGSSITGTGFGIDVSGGGKLNLTGSSSYTGVTTFGAGTTVNVATLSNYGVNGSLGNRAVGGDSGVSNVSMRFMGGTLQYTGSTAQSTDRGIRVGTTGATLDASGTNAAATMNFTKSTANEDIWDSEGSRTLRLTGSNTGNNTFAINWQERVGDANRSNIIKSGGGTWVLTNTHNSDAANNTYNQFGGYSGGTRIEGGTLGFANNAIGGGLIDFTGSATLRWETGNTQDVTVATGTGVARGIKINDGVTATFDTNGNNVTLSNALQVGVSATGALTKSGAGILTLGGANTYTGTTTIANGTLALTGSGSLSDSSAVNLTGATSSFSISGISGSGETVASLAGVAGSTVVLGAKLLTVGGTNASTSFAGVISGTGGMTKNGSGTMTLTGANTYTGTTTIGGGTLTLSGGGALADTGAVNFSTTGTSLSISGITAGSETLGSLAGVAGSTVVLGTKELIAGGNNTSTTFAGVVSGTGALTKNGTGNLTLSGANTYSGATTINGGTLTLSGSGALADTSAVNLSTTGTRLDISGISAGSETIASLAGASGSTVELGGKGLVSGGNNTSTTFAGVASGTGGLTKTGTGALTLSGANTYSGTTVINGGSLVLGANNVLPTAPVTLAGGRLMANGKTDTTGTLLLSSSSVIDMAGAGSALAFANSTALSWTGILSIWNWPYNNGAVRFGTTSGGLTATQLSRIQMYSGSGTGTVYYGKLDSNGYLIAVPEPGAVISCLLLLAGIGWRERRHFVRCRQPLT